MSTQNFQSLSFFVRIDHLEPNYQAQPAQHGQNTYWSPPDIRTAYTHRGSILFRWHGGTMTHVLANNSIGHALHHIHSAATVFTQNPDTPHLLIVPYDARLRHANLNPGGWRPLVFRHVRIGNTQHTYSAVLANGDCQHIAAPGSPHWMPQLLPRVYDYQTGPHRTQAGLIGSLPLLIALAAFSAPSTALVGVLPASVRPRRWMPHQHHYPAGREFPVPPCRRIETNRIQILPREAWSSPSSWILRTLKALLQRC